MKNLFLVLCTRLSDHDLVDVLLSATRARVETVAPADALKFLFNLDAELYPIQGWTSVAYGGGIHTKHRHTKYHDFFTDRVEHGERVLDIGCGNGALSRDVAEKSGAHVVGIDLSADNIDTAKKKHSHSRVQYETGDVLTKNLQGPFDTVIMSNVLEHLEQRAEFLHRVTETVKPGKFLLRVPVFERDWRVPLKAELGIDYRLDPTHFIEYTLESFAEEIALAGLTVVHQEVRWGEIWAEAVPGNAPEFSQE
jgi:ubiquinone/menaquinone biosynthesis C-methylase UbiE